MIITSNLTSAAPQATFCRINCPPYKRLLTAELEEDCLSAILKWCRTINVSWIK